MPPSQLDGRKRRVNEPLAMKFITAKDATSNSPATQTPNDRELLRREPKARGQNWEAWGSGGAEEFFHQSEAAKGMGPKPARPGEPPALARRLWAGLFSTAKPHRKGPSPAHAPPSPPLKAPPPPSPYPSILPSPPHAAATSNYPLLCLRPKLQTRGKATK
ncbi:uncharacterized protein CLUP02_16471 [Colletotrichum lupini]|uniref:Uncharacterized protein n=1 Tax=Colletotrichum lupini TaxID=145971 RepID=A0A9Q8WPK1_9PEZI|nr:uncharacterized protein CLUP02_16471 [Colletotrichum lupini]UQC90939.1 hypothetical protein CLUP02_16471 [Colletotrichum lupini]